ncbi:MAG: hypothetical protein HQ469_10430 [Cyanobacteria bacterium]|nr:hypothetical protein [Cyanobacteria bacterium bin.275]
MANLRSGGVNRRPSPQLPAFCRSRRQITTTVRVSSLQQLLWLLWLVLALQLSTILLLLAGPVPAPRRPQAGAPLATTGAAAATVLSPSQL